MAITNYSELQTAIGRWMNRSDLTSRIPEFISMAEARMGRDVRLRHLSVLDFTAVEQYELPVTFKAMIDLYHDGADRFGAIKIVGAGDLGNMKSRYGDTGVPAYAAVIDGPASTDQHYIRFAPEPSGNYPLRMTYEAALDALSDINTSNWLLSGAPDLYLFASLSEAEGYLQEDERVALWEQKYAQGANEYKLNRSRREYGGRLVAMPSAVIGEGVNSGYY